MRFNPGAAASLAPGVVTLSGLAEMIFATISELESDVRTLETRSREAATTDRDYRRERSVAYLMAKGTIPEREATVAKATDELRFRSQLAEDLKVAALEAVRSRRAKLSALQTLANSLKAEMDLVGYGPHT